MNTRTKDPARVRVDALRVASRKLTEGCAPCASAYLDLARRNGASEQEIRTLSPGTVQPAKLASTPAFFGTSSTGLSRQLQAESKRDVVKVSAQGDFNRFGTDTNTSPSLNPHLTDFYIGRLGKGQTISRFAFNTDAAREAGRDYTYGYWVLVGPNNKPKNIQDNRAWGAEQARWAIQAKTVGPNAKYVGGRTIFADIEENSGGWANYQWLDNQDVLDGFLNLITSSGFIPGVYINALDPDGPNHFYFAPDYTPSASFVLWIAGLTCGLSICEPAAGCNPCIEGCDPKTTVQDNWNNIVQNACLAGQGAVIWQFWIYPACGADPVCGDFDYSPQSGYQLFTPRLCTATPCLGLEQRRTRALRDNTFVDRTIKKFLASIVEGDGTLAGPGTNPIPWNIGENGGSAEFHFDNYWTATDPVSACPNIPAWLSRPMCDTVDLVDKYLYVRDWGFNLDQQIDYIGVHFTFGGEGEVDQTYTTCFQTTLKFFGYAAAGGLRRYQDDPGVSFNGGDDDGSLTYRGSVQANDPYFGVTLLAGDYSDVQGHPCGTRASVVSETTPQVPSLLLTAKADWVKAVLPAGSPPNFREMSDLGFSIPAGATIISIELQLTLNSGGGTVQLRKSSSAYGTGKSLVAGTKNYSDSPSGWGLSLSPSDVNASGFGLRIVFDNTATDVVFNWIRVRYRS